MSEAKSSLSI